MELSQYGLEKFDILLLWACPVCAIIGSFAHFLIVDISDFTTPKRAEGAIKIATNLEAIFRLKWIISRCIIGGILGLIISLYFIGIIKEDINSVARILAFTILLGYSAPKLWMQQEKIFSKIVDKKLEKLIEDTLGNIGDKESLVIDFSVFQNIFFEINEVELDKNEIQKLNKIATYLLSHKNIQIKIIGNTDNTGDENFNNELSEKRAKRVFEYLTSQFNIPENRFSTKGVGSTTPIGDNNKDLGRQLNRRVEFKIENTEQNKV